MGSWEGLLQGCRRCVGPATPTGLSTAIPRITCLGSSPGTCHGMWHAHLPSPEAPRWTRQPQTPASHRVGADTERIPPNAPALGSPWHHTFQRHCAPVSCPRSTRSPHPHAVPVSRHRVPPGCPPTAPRGLAEAQVPFALKPGWTRVAGDQGWPTDNSGVCTWACVRGRKVLTQSETWDVLKWL